MNLERCLIWLVLPVGFLLCWPVLPCPAAGQDPARADGDLVLVYVGTYTRGTSEGIYLCHLDLSTGRLELAGLAAGAVNPSFLAIHPSRPLLYAVGEMGNFAGQKTGAVSAFSIDRKTGELSPLNQAAYPATSASIPPGRICWPPTRQPTTWWSSGSTRPPASCFRPATRQPFRRRSA